MGKLPNYNLDDYEVRDTLNEHGGVTDNVFGSKFRRTANVNKWAYHKPESYDSIFAMSDHERKMNNHGFDVTSITGNIEELFEKAANSWVYILPTGGEHSPFRIGDFRGYNPNAKPPFDYHYIMKTGETIDGTADEVWRVVANADAEIKMSDMVVFEDMNASHYMFVARKSNGSNYEYINSSMVSMNGDPTTIDCSINFPSDGTWECLFCIGQNTDTPIESRTDLAIMPDGYFTYTLVKKVAFVTITYVSPILSDVYYNSADYSLNIGSIITLKLKAFDQSVSVPSTEFKFGMIMELYDGGGSFMDSRSVYSTGSNDNIIYTGTEEKTWQVVDFPSPLYLTNYFDQYQIDSASKVRLRIDVHRVSGNGAISMDNVYYDYDLR
jgi:hypothetical protein